LDLTLAYSEKYDVIIIGAGMSGITAGNILQEKGLKVKLLDKGKGIGGRLATRRIQYKDQKVVFDYGTQYIHAENKSFENILYDLHQKDITRIWKNSSSDTEKKFIGKKSIRDIAMFLASDLDILNNCKVTQIKHQDDNWILTTNKNENFISDNLILTTPVPQSLKLMDNSAITIDSQIKSKLEEIEYERCIVALLILDNSNIYKSFGGLKFSEGPISFIGNNNQKGVNSGYLAFTVEMSDDFSNMNWDLNNEKIISKIIELSSDWLISPVLDYQIHKWKYSRPSKFYNKKFEIIEAPSPIYLAGDTFLGNSVESAYFSGLAAAENLSKKLNLD
jgi:renalase